MKKHNKFLFIALLITILSSSLAGCNLISAIIGGGKSFSLEKSSIIIKIGEIYEVQLSEKSSKENFKLSSSDESKVEVIDDTKLKGVNKTTSTVTITAVSASGKEDTLSVTVAYADIGELDIKVKSGKLIQLIDPDDTPESIDFEAVTNTGIDPNTLFSWKARLKGANGDIKTGRLSSFSFTPVEREKIYEVLLSAKGMTASVECGIYNSIYITVAKQKYQTGKDAVEITVKFRLPEGYHASTVPFGVIINGENTGTQIVYYEGVDDVKSASVTLDAFDTVGTKSVIITFNGCESNVISFETVNFTAVNHIYVNAQDENKLNQRGTCQTVKFNATVSPSTASADKLQWYVNGVYKGTGASFEYLPESGYGEYTVEAKDGNVCGQKKTIVYLNSSSAAESYANYYFDYGGYPQNRYITSQEELNNIILYVLENKLHGSSSDRLDIFVDFNYGETLDDELLKARLAMVESGIIAGNVPSPLATSDGKVFKMYFNYNLSDGSSIVNQPTTNPIDIPNNTMTQSTKSKPAYTSLEKAREFYVDTAGLPTMEVNTSNMLYKAVQWGYKPNITDDKVQQIYNNARDVLRKIISDDMSELQKVKAIYEWIVFNVRYDFDLSEVQDIPAKETYIGSEEERESLVLNNKMKYYGFYLEGIFLDKFYLTDMHAVCDGKSKAFSLLCGIEGIDSERICGTVSGGGHAWNKVLLDTDADGQKDWFVVDTTWGDVAPNANSGGNTEYLTYAYFLLNDKIISSTHKENKSQTYPVAAGVYNYYEENLFTYGGKTHDYVIGDTLLSPYSDQLKIMFSYSNSNNVTYVEFVADYNYTDMETLQNHIRNAITKTKYVSFSVINLRDDVFAVILSLSQ